jgi:transposase
MTMLLEIDEISMKKGQDYLTVVHDLDGTRLLFSIEGRDHQTVEKFALDLQAHGGKRSAIAHVCMDMSAAYAKGAMESLLQAQISYDRYHVMALANKRARAERSCADAAWGTARTQARHRKRSTGSSRLSEPLARRSTLR